MRYILCTLLLFLSLTCAHGDEITLTYRPATPTDLTAQTAEGPFLPDGAEPILTESSYTSQDIAITITSMRYADSDVYVADIYVRQVENLQRVYGGGQWKKKTDKVAKLAEESGAILAITGDSGQNFDAGLNIGNGTVWRDTRNRKRDVALLYKDGSFRCYEAPVDKDMLSAQVDSVWQSFLFGPVLLDENGKAKTKFNSNVLPNNPRSAFGYYEPGHYCLVQVDGRSTKSKLEEKRKNRGVDMETLSKLMEELGCTAAYNLDGGRSSMMWFGGQIISTPQNGGRSIGDVVAVIEIEK